MLENPPVGRRLDTQAYYDEFSKGYEKLRGANDPGGYHELVDDLEVDFASRYAAGADLLEVGCGTGLLLERLAKVAKSARGIDLSPGMLAKGARPRSRCPPGKRARAPLPRSDVRRDLLVQGPGPRGGHRNARSPR